MIKGLRTYSRYSPFPEEINRRLTGTLGALHFTPTNTSAKNLLLENISESKIIITGNTVIDSLLWMSNQPPTDSASSLMERLYFGVSDRKSVRLILVTAHRRENWGAPLENICRAVERISKSFPDVRILFPMHLNPLVQNTAKSILGKNENIILSNPLEYDIFAFVMKSIYLVMTDSGGIQEEATAFSVPILVLRKSTERPEGVDAGMAKLIGTDEDVVVKEATLMLSDISMYGKMVKKNSPYGDGHASEKIVDKILATDGLIHYDLE